MKNLTLLNTIGNTPFIEIKNVVKNKNIHLYSKLEGQNPGGSIKDRIALYMIKKAEKRGNLNKNKTILEATSGNMGISLSMIGANKGYKVHIVMSEGMSEERKKMLRAFGAKLILTNKKLGTEGAIETAKKLANNDPKKYWFVNQFNNADNVNSHYYDLAPEILNNIKKIDYFITGIGTSGTIMGIAKRFKQDSPHTKIIGVIPPSGYRIQGLQNPKQDFIGKIYKKSILDQVINVSKDEAYKMSRFLAKKEGLFVGMSSGASVFAAKEIAKKLKSGNIVTIFPDRGEKYLSTELYS